jgi:O-antigen ligase
MVLGFSLLVLIITHVNNKKIFIIIIPITFVIILFSPLKSRFNDILNQKDFSILQEKRIVDEADPRINGLTFRLILWREALNTMHGKDYVLGKGVTDQTDKLLEDRLVNLGLLSHKSFNPHNQYVDTFWRTGVFGLVLLILIPIYSLVIGIKRKDKLIIQFSLFMFVVMWTESIFGRVNGVYFFTTVILILMNSNKVNENSNTRHQRNTQ